MERVLGRDLADVRIHTDGAPAREVDRIGAAAMTRGNDVTFAEGRYAPGTPLGDALLAHELAHTLQQRDGDHRVRSRAALERSADRSASAALRELWGARVDTARSSAERTRAPARADSATQFMFCEPENRVERPAYLGPHSHATLDNIEGILESGELLQYMIVFGTAVTLGTSAPQDTLATRGYDIEPQARALGDVEQITIMKVRQQIEFLILSHGNDLNAEERQFWDRLYERLGALL
jgi:hypothetical protein